MKFELNRLTDYSEEAIEQMKRFMQVGTSNAKVFYTETQTQISSPELTAADFQFALPEGAVFKESNDSY